MGFQTLYAGISISLSLSGAAQPLKLPLNLVPVYLGLLIAEPVIYIVGMILAYVIYEKLRFAVNSANASLYENYLAPQPPNQHNPWAVPESHPDSNPYVESSSAKFKAFQGKGHRLGES